MLLISSHWTKFRELKSQTANILETLIASKSTIRKKINFFLDFQNKLWANHFESVIFVKAEAEVLKSSSGFVSSKIFLYRSTPFGSKNLSLTNFSKLETISFCYIRPDFKAIFDRSAKSTIQRLAVSLRNGGSFADVGIRTADLWCWKRPLYHSHWVPERKKLRRDLSSRPG